MSYQPWKLLLEPSLKTLICLTNNKQNNLLFPFTNPTYHSSVDDLEESELRMRFNKSSNKNIVPIMIASIKPIMIVSIKDQIYKT